MNAHVRGEAYLTLDSPVTRVVLRIEFEGDAGGEEGPCLPPTPSMTGGSCPQGLRLHMKES